MSVNRKLDEVLRRLENLERIAIWILRKEYQMAGELDALEAQVTENTNLEASAIVLIEGLAAQIAAAANDPAKIIALTATLKDSAAKLATAITANTSPPAAPPA
jgi:hypothetical protein